MNTQEKNQRLAEHLGWHNISPRFIVWSDEGGGGSYLGLVGKRENIEDEIPDYCHDLNAIAQAEAMLTEWQRRDYLEDLECIVTNRTMVENTMWRVATASAEQRVDALLSALSVDGGEKQPWMV